MEKITPSGPLTDRMKAFAEYYVEAGASWGDGAEAARKAGYSEKSVYQVAHNLLKDKRIRDYMWELAQARIGAGLAMGLEGLMQFASGRRFGLDAPCSEELQFKALKELRELNGAQVIKQSEHRVAVTHQELAPEERRARIDALKQELGIIEVEAVPVATLPSPEPVDWDATLAAEFENE